MRRVLGTAAGVLALATVAVPSSLGAPRADPPAPTYSFFSANSSADGIRVHFDVIGFLPVTPALSLGTVTAQGFVESTRRTASALLPDPGPVLVATPGLAAGLVGVPNVPGYPLVALADDPFTPHSEASPVLGTGVAVIRADADATSAAALARVTGAGSGDGLAGLDPINELVASLVEGLDLPLTGALVEASAAEATAEETQPSATRLTATSTSRLSGVSLLGGLVRIASIETTASARLEGAVAAADPPVVNVSGVTVAGVPARLGEQGLSLAGSDSPLGGLLAPLTDPLLEQGLSVKVAPSEARASGTTASAHAGGVVIEVRSAYQGYPVVLRVTLGDARAAVQATVRDAAESSGVVLPSGPVPGLGPMTTSFPDLSAPTGTVSSRPTAPSTPVQTIAEVLDLRRVYPWLAALAGLLAGSRLLASSLVRGRPGSRRAVQDLFRW